MRIVKGIVSLILALVLLFTAGLAMGLNAAEDAMHAESIQRAMTESAVLEDAIGDVLADSTEELNGIIGNNDIYQNIAQDILGNIDSLYGELEDIAGQEGYDFSQIEENYIQQAIESEMPDITAQIDQQLENYEATEEETFIGELFANDGFRAMMSEGFRTILTVVSVILAIAIIALCWRSKLGFLWCSIVMGALSLLYVTMSLMGEALGVIMGATENESMLITMLTEGFGNSAKTGFIITAVLIAAFVILKITDKRRNRHEKDFKTSERYA